MAKLTRTQKYADLRNELANDKETANATQDLNSYADRFNNVQNTLAPEAPIRPAIEPDYAYKPNNDSYYDSFMNASRQEQKNDYSSYFNDSRPEDLSFENIYRGVFTGVNDSTDSDISRDERNTYLDQTINDVHFHNMATGQTTLNQIVNDTVNEVRHTEPARPQYVEPQVQNNYAYNQAPVQNTVLDADAIDDDFSNTVSMEISKIMNQMEEPAPVVQETIAPKPVDVTPTPVTVAPTVQEPVYVNQNVQPVVEEQKSINQTAQFEKPVEQAAYATQNVQFETPVVNTVIEEKPQEPIEIRNIDEVKEETMRNTVSGTIPFVVTADEETDIEDDEEADGSNVVLNVILIVLIIVLMAVLGLIIFYILKTKGIL